MLENKKVDWNDVYEVIIKKDWLTLFVFTFGLIILFIRLVNSLCFVISSILQIPYSWNVLWWFRSNNIHDCVRMAQSKTGLTDFGDGDSSGEEMILKYDIARKVGLSESKAQYTTIGYLFVRRVLTNRLSIHLRLIDYMKRHPCILKIPIKQPIFITGFPRTGTTFLHELLGLHSGVKSHRTWHQMSPVPTTDHIDSYTALCDDLFQRYQKNKFFFNFALKVLSILGSSSSVANMTSTSNNSTSTIIKDNDIQKVHRIGYDEIEECTILCGMGLPWALTEIPFIPFATKDIIHLGAGNAYKNYKKFLQLMSCQLHDCFEIMNPKMEKCGDNSHNNNYDEMDGKSNNSSNSSTSSSSLSWSWMLKCPFHLPYLTDLFTTFPDAVIVWTHRHPIECIASACSLGEIMINMASVKVDRYALGKAVLEYTMLCLKRAEESLKEIGLEFKINAKPSSSSTMAQSKIKVIHVRYQDTIKNPKSICRMIIEQAGMIYTDDYDVRIDNYLRENLQGRKRMQSQKGSSSKDNHGDSKNGSNKDEVDVSIHEYNLSDYGLNEKEIGHMFRNYIKAFDL